jgi:hypothetical protein
MSELSKITPVSKNRIIDLVREAGINTDPWSNFRGGIGKAASNPNYAYEWAFVEPHQVVVLCLWLENISEDDSGVYYSMNLRFVANAANNVLSKKRAIRMDEAIQLAITEKIPIRAVICTGRNENNTTQHTKKRLLDKVTWSVASYNSGNSDCILKRGEVQTFIDQFSLTEDSVAAVEKRDISSQAFVRNPEIRNSVLSRANGKCEFCSQSGFKSMNGSIYLETHHIVPLSENGADAISNVIALCPNHHREAHHGTEKAELLKKFTNIIQEHSNKQNQ